MLCTVRSRGTVNQCVWCWYSPAVDWLCHPSKDALRLSVEQLHNWQSWQCAGDKTHNCALNLCMLLSWGRHTPDILDKITAFVGEAAPAAPPSLPFFSKPMWSVFLIQTYTYLYMNYMYPLLLEEYNLLMIKELSLTVVPHQNPKYNLVLSQCL